MLRHRHHRYTCISSAEIPSEISSSSVCDASQAKLPVIAASVRTAMIGLLLDPAGQSCRVVPAPSILPFVEGISSPSARSRVSRGRRRLSPGLAPLHEGVGAERPKAHFVFGLRMCQLSPLTHRTSILRFCTQSCGRGLKRRGCRGSTPGTVSQSALPIDRRAFSSTYCLPDPRQAG